jgi:hypothetical protein
MNIFPRIYKGEGGEKVLHLRRGIHFLFNQSTSCSEIYGPEDSSRPIELSQIVSS